MSPEQDKHQSNYTAKSREFEYLNKRVDDYKNMLLESGHHQKWPRLLNNIEPENESSPL